MRIICLHASESGSGRGNKATLCFTHEPLLLEDSPPESTCSNMALYTQGVFRLKTSSLGLSHLVPLVIVNIKTVASYRD